MRTRNAERVRAERVTTLPTGCSTWEQLSSGCFRNSPRSPQAGPSSSSWSAAALRGAPTMRKREGRKALQTLSTRPGSRSKKSAKPATGSGRRFEPGCLPSMVCWLRSSTSPINSLPSRPLRPTRLADAPAVRDLKPSTIAPIPNLGVASRHATAYAFDSNQSETA